MGVEIKHEASTSEENGEKEEGRNKHKQKAETVPFHKLFAFADSTDNLLMVVGSIGAIGNGVALPLLALLLGQIIDNFGGSKPNSNVLQDVSKVIPSHSPLTLLINSVFNNIPSDILL